MGLADTSVIGFQGDVRVYGRALGSAELDAVRLQATPEPSSVALVDGLGFLGLLYRRARA